MSNLFAYIRVSTTKQGQQGVSLQEQRAAIERYAQQNRLTIITWFEEQETAAKRGRAVFGQMLRSLKAGKADGVVIHKIDRSARNLKDWADLGELIDQGITVHFANESLDLHTRGGRLSADIQAVVASDYIRNLREETRKGFYGRLKQGLYPLPAPIGYLDKGQGKPKELDPMKAPLVKKAFHLYGTGRFNLAILAKEMYRLGLRNKRGGRVTKSGLSTMLNNPFYIGLIHLTRTGQTFPAVHEPLIRKAQFDRVQNILKGKWNGRSQRHDFLFHRLLACKHCNYSLVGETQKSHRYYRCHTKQCPVTCVREEFVQEEALKALSPLQLKSDELAYLRNKIGKMEQDWVKEREVHVKAFELNHQQVQIRIDRLMDAYLDRSIEKEAFEERNRALLLERKAVEEKLHDLKEGKLSIPAQITNFLEHAKSAYLSFKIGFPDERQDLLKSVTSNRFVEGKNVEFQLKSPFQEVANRTKSSNGGPYCGDPRTFYASLDKLISKLVTHFTQEMSACKEGDVAGDDK